MGFYKVFLMVGASFITVGSGMIYTLEPGSSSGKYIGYQILSAVGSGLVIQLNVIVAQAVSQRSDMAVAIAIVLCKQQILVDSSSSFLVEFSGLKSSLANLFSSLPVPRWHNWGLGSN